MMKTTAKRKRVHVDGMDLYFYRFKIFYTDYKGSAKTLVRWESTAKNAILSVVKQYGWSLAECIPPIYDEDYCQTLVRVLAGTHNYYYRVEAFQNDF